MWEVIGQQIDTKRFLPFQPNHVLNDYDGPRIFTFIDTAGQLHLACWSDENETHSRYLVVPTSEKIISELESGKLAVSAALAQSAVYVVDVKPSGVLELATEVRLDTVPADAQPKPGVLLYRKPDLHFTHNLASPGLEVNMQHVG